MNSISLKYLKIFVGLFIWYLPAQGQYSITNLDLSNSDLSEWFDNTIGVENTSLVEGSYYPVIIKSETSHAFYLENYWINGELFFKKQKYQVNMMYDVFNDILVIQNTSSLKLRNEPLKLPQNHIDSFKLKGHVFKPFFDEEAPAQPGFYDVLFDGSTVKLYAKRVKKEKVEKSIIYYSKDDYYLIVEDETFVVRNKRAFIRAFPDHKSSVRQFARNSAMLIWEKNDNDLVQLAKHCQQIILKQ